MLLQSPSSIQSVLVELEHWLTNLVTNRKLNSVDKTFSLVDVTLIFHYFKPPFEHSNEKSLRELRPASYGQGRPVDKVARIWAIDLGPTLRHERCHVTKNTQPAVAMSCAFHRDHADVIASATRNFTWSGGYGVTGRDRRLCGIRLQTGHGEITIGYRVSTRDGRE